MIIIIYITTTDKLLTSEGDKALIKSCLFAIINKGTRAKRSYNNNNNNNNNICLC